MFTVFFMKIVFMETLSYYIIWKMLHLVIFLCRDVRTCKIIFIYYSAHTILLLQYIIVENVDLYYENVVAFFVVVYTTDILII